MKRRECLLTGGGLVVMSVAGCTAESGDGGEGNAETASAALSPPALLSHDVRRMAVGEWRMVVTMSNETDYQLDRAVGNVAIYDGDTRLANGRAAVMDLEPGITDSASALLGEFSPDDVSHYTITMSGETEDYEETETEEFEFGGDEFRDRL